MHTCICVCIPLFVHCVYADDFVTHELVQARMHAYMDVCIYMSLYVHCVYADDFEMHELVQACMHAYMDVCVYILVCALRIRR
jgi:hypothetical protein